MWKRQIILLVCVLALVLGIGWFVSWRQEARRIQHETYLVQINDADPYKRLLAAEGLIRRDSSDHARRMIRARALIELNRHAEAREELQTLIVLDKGNLEAYAALQIESYLTEAHKMVAGGDRQRTDTLVERIEAMMTGVTSQKALITSVEQDYEVRLIEARRLDVLVRAHRFALESKSVDLTKARISGVQQTIETLGLEVAEIQKIVVDHDAAIVEACARLMKAKPLDARPAALLFHSHLRRGEFAAARALAQAFTTWKELPVETAAAIADALLDLETSFGEPVTADDVKLAGQLLDHPGKTGKGGITLDLARATHAIAIGDAQTAMDIAQAIVTKEWLHARALCIAARAHLLVGNYAQAIEILQKYTELKSEPMVRYTLGLAFLAAPGDRQISLGQSALRECLEIEPNHLPARLRLIESLATSGFVIEASDDIQIVEQINPDHPRVLALKIQLAMATEDLGVIASVIEQQLTSQATKLVPVDVAMVIGMALDDLPRVERLAAESAAAQPHSVFVMLSERWTKLDAVRRARISPVIVRTLHAHLDRDPMQSPLRPTFPALGSLKPAVAGEASAAYDPLEPFTQNHFLPRPLTVASQMADLAVEQWPGDARLLSGAIELNIWRQRIKEARQGLAQLQEGTNAAGAVQAGDGGAGSLRELMAAYLQGRFDDVPAIVAKAANHDKNQTDPKEHILSPTHRLLQLDMALRSQDAKSISESLSAMLLAHPWAETALIMAVTDAIQRDQSDRAFAMLGNAEQINPQLASLTRARLNLGLGRAAEALMEIERVVAHEGAASEIRRWAAEVRARAHLLMDQQSLALGVFDLLAMSVKEHRMEIAMASADVLLAYGKGVAAGEVISQLVADARNPAREIDQLLARAEAVMQPSRVRAISEQLLTYRANDPVLMLYQAAAMAHEDDLVAERVIKTVISQNASAPRAMMDMARLMRKIQPDETRRIYTELAKRSGRVGAQARLLLEEMNRPPAAPSSAANVEELPE